MLSSLRLCKTSLLLRRRVECILTHVQLSTSSCLWPAPNSTMLGGTHHLAAESFWRCLQCQSHSMRWGARLVAGAEALLEAKGRAQRPQSPPRHDGNAVPQDVRLQSQAEPHLNNT